MRNVVFNHLAQLVRKTPTLKFPIIGDCLVQCLHAHHSTVNDIVTMFFEYEAVHCDVPRAV